MNVGRIASSLSHLVFNPEFQDATSKALKASRKAQGWKNIHTQIKDAFIAGDKATKGTNLWQSMKNSVTSLPKDMKSMWQNTTGAWAKTKGVFSQLGKRMPVIGGLMMVGFELPNIFSAFKDEGLIGGILETAKSSARLVGSMAGFAIGQALIPIPFLGGLIGGIVGDMLTGLIVGERHSDKKAKAEQAMMEAQDKYQEAQKVYQQIQNTPQGNLNQTAQNIQMPRMTMTPQQIMQMGQMLYGGGMINPMHQDFMAMTSGMNRLNYMC